MVRWILRGVAAVVLLAFLLAASVAGYVWHLGNEAMSRAKASGWFEVATDGRLTAFESTVQRAFFSKKWKDSTFPCRTIRQTWANITNNREPYPGMTVSYVLANHIAFDEFEPDPTLESHLRRASLDCHLDSQFDDIALLRMHLKRVGFSEGLVGADSAAQAIFGKYAGELGGEESIRLAALYDWPKTQRTHEEWDERTEWIHERIRRRD